MRQKTDITKYLRLLSVWATGVFLYAGDFLVKRIELPGEPLNIEIWLDHYIPFDPRWAWMYMGGWLVFLFGMAGLYIYENRHEWKNVRMLLFAGIFMQVSAWIVHYLWPTTMPRPEVVPGQWDAATTWLINHIYTTDPPTHVLPSLHLASIAVVTWFWARGGSARRMAARWVMVGLIAASVVLTKQHGIVDVFAGIAWAYMACWVGVYLGREWDRLVRLAPVHR
jgi:membrane-associated phospholipid phosphatase